jgi:hypothetical protein
MSGKKGASFVVVVCAAATGFAEQPLVSSYGLHEQQRRQAIAAQIGTQEHLRWLSGLPSRLWWQFDGASPQAWGHRATPTGPNGYTYEPVYEPPWPAPPLLWPAIPAHPMSPRMPAPPQAPLEELPPPVSHPELREF